MDMAEFQNWLCGISRLSKGQLQRTLAALRDAESAGERDGAGIGGSSLLDAATGGSTESPGGETVAAKRPAPTSISGVGARSVAQAGHCRVESLGCPHCAGQEVIAWGQANAMPRYRCKSCKRTFNGLTKTPLAGLRKKDRWLEHASAMIDGTSVAETAERCDVHYTTAFRWRHRFLAAPSLDKPKTLTGIVEADETFILESFKGKRSDLARPSRKRGGKAAKRGLSAEQIPIIVARDRNGATTDAVLPKLNRASIAAALDGVVTPANQFCCDGGAAIVAFARKAAIPVHVLPAPGAPNPQAPQFHINNVNAYHGRLKEWMRRFHGVATKNLPNYLGWRRALEAWGPQASPENCILGAIGMGPYQQSTQ
jgi:transposase-like protein